MYFLHCFVVIHSTKGKADDERKALIESTLLIMLFFRGLDSCLMIKFFGGGQLEYSKSVSVPD